MASDASETPLDHSQQAVGDGPVATPTHDRVVSELEILGAAVGRTSLAKLVGSPTELLRFGQIESRRSVFDDNRWKRCFARLVHFSIVLNGLCLGLGAWLQGGHWPLIWLLVEQAFTLFYTLETLVKLWYLRWEYGYCWWNRLDLLLNLVAVLDNWIVPIASQTTNNFGGNVLAFRLLRLLRLFGLIRVVKLSRRITVLSSGIIASVWAMVPTMALLALLIYMFALVCTDYIRGIDYQDEFDVDLYFGSLPRAWFTLFNVCILAEWVEIVRPLFEHAPQLIIPFVLFMMICSFGIMNVIIGIICERTAYAAEQSRVQEEEGERKQQMACVKRLAKQITMLDANHDGMVSPAELDHRSCKDIFVALRLPQGFTGEELHLMLDSDGSGEVSIQEFIECMFQLIFADNFQNECLTRASLNQIKRSLVKQAREICNAVRTLNEAVGVLHNKVLPELASMKAAASGANEELSSKLTTHAAVPASAGTGKDFDRILHQVERLQEQQLTHLAAMRFEVADVQVNAIVARLGIRFDEMQEFLAEKISHMNLSTSTSASFLLREGCTSPVGSLRPASKNLTGIVQPMHRAQTSVTSLYSPRQTSPNPLCCMSGRSDSHRANEIFRSESAI